MNHHPLHINDVYAAQSQQGRNVVVGPLRLLARARHERLRRLRQGDRQPRHGGAHATRRPVFHGDTLFAESEVLEVRESRSKPDRGTVKVHTRVLNQDGVLVAEFKRARARPAPTLIDSGRFARQDGRRVAHAG